MESVLLKNYELDSELYYQKGNTEITSTKEFVGTVDVYAISFDDTKTKLLSDVDLLEKRYFNLGPDIKEVVMESTKGSVLKPNGKISFSVSIGIRDHSKTVSKKTQRFLDVYGSSKFIKSQVVGHDSSFMFWYHDEYQPKTQIKKKIRDQKNTYLVGDHVTYETELAFGSLWNEDIIEYTQLVDVLPEGLTYVDNSSSQSFLNGSKYTTNQSDFEIEPTLIKNYEDTGRDALVWELGTLSSIMYGPTLPFLKLTYDLEVGLDMSKGNTESISYLGWKDTEKIKPSSGSDYDIFDLSQNGEYDDVISVAGTRFNFTAPNNIKISKKVKGNLDDTFKPVTQLAYTEVNREVLYQVELVNDTGLDYYKLEIIDVLPHLNDTSISNNLGSYQDEQLKRGSEYQVTLKGPITMPSGYEVMYSYEIPHYDTSDYVGSVTWLTELSDYTKVKSIKISLIPGFSLNNGQSVTIDMKTSINTDQLIQDGMVARNSVGVNTHSTFNSNESNLAELELVSYKVSGSVFDDSNNNRVDDDVDGFENHLVQLVYEDGSVVYDSNGNKVETLSDTQGHYEMDVYESGDYRIKVITPEGYKPIDVILDDPDTSHINESTMSTDVFTLNLDQRHVIRNAGYTFEDTSLKLSLSVFNADQEIIQNDETFNFTVLVANQPYEGPAELDGIKIDIESGKVTLGTTSVLEIHKLKRDQPYTIIQEAKKGYDMIPTSGMHEGILDKQSNSVAFINTYHVSYFTYSGLKEWVGGPRVHPDIEVQLYQDGIELFDAIYLTNNNTSFSWEHLPLTDLNGIPYAYTVKEVSVPYGYEARVQGSTITNTYREDEDTEIPIEKPEPPVGDKDESYAKPTLPNTAVSIKTSYLSWFMILGGWILIRKRQKN